MICKVFQCRLDIAHLFYKCFELLAFVYTEFVHLVLLNTSTRDLNGCQGFFSAHCDCSALEVLLIFLCILLVAIVN